MLFRAVCTVEKKRFQSSAKGRCWLCSFQFSRQLVPCSRCGGGKCSIRSFPVCSWDDVVSATGVPQWGPGASLYFHLVFLVLNISLKLWSWQKIKWCSVQQNIFLHKPLTHLKQRRSGPTLNNVSQQGNERVAKRLSDCVKACDSTSNTCCNFWYHKTFYFCNRYIVCQAGPAFSALIFHNQTLRKSISYRPCIVTVCNCRLQKISCLLKVIASCPSLLAIQCTVLHYDW